MVSGLSSRRTLTGWLPTLITCLLCLGGLGSVIAGSRHGVDSRMGGSSRGPATSSVPGGIPRLIHQVFLSGRDALREEEEAPNSKFRRDWRRSCQVHNPGWRYMLWDQALAEQLLRDKYPWFLHKFQSIDMVVLRGDAIRPFILHAYGGVYLDMDTECFGPLDDSLTGHSLVLQGETRMRVNNAQMASVAKHPFWLSLHQRLVSFRRWNTSVTPREVLSLSGPIAVSQLLRRHLNLNGSVPLEGLTTLDTAWRRDTTIRVYGLKEWDRATCRIALARCAPVVRALAMARWRSTTNTSFSAAALPPTADITTAATGSALPGGQARQAALPTTEAYRHLLAQWRNVSRLPPQAKKARARLRVHEAPKPYPVHCVVKFGSLVGAHHFSGSWLADTEPDPDAEPLPANATANPEDMIDEAYQVRLQSAEGLVSFFNASSLFLEANTTRSTSSLLSLHHHHQQQQGGSSSSSSTDDLSSKTANGGKSVHAGCQLLSITQFRHPNTRELPCCGQESTQVHELALWAARHNCSLTVMSDRGPSDPAWDDLQPQGVKVRQAGLCLRQPCKNATVTLPDMLSGWQEDHSGPRLMMLHVSCPGNCTWAALRQLQTLDSSVLLSLRPKAILIETGPLASQDLKLLSPAYQHLYQELGYVGHYHHHVQDPDYYAHGSDTDQQQPARTGTDGSDPDRQPAQAGTSTASSGSSSTCTPCRLGDEMQPYMLPALRLGFTQLQAATGQWS